MQTHSEEWMKTAQRRKWGKEEEYSVLYLHSTVKYTNMWQKADQWLLRDRVEARKDYLKSNKVFGGNEYIHYLDHSDGFPAYAYIKNEQIVHFEYLHFIVFSYYSIQFPKIVYRKIVLGMC